MPTPPPSSGPEPRPHADLEALERKLAESERAEEDAWIEYKLTQAPAAKERLHAAREAVCAIDHDIAARQSSDADPRADADRDPDPELEEWYQGLAEWTAAIIESTVALAKTPPSEWPPLSAPAEIARAVGVCDAQQLAENGPRNEARRILRTLAMRSPLTVPRPARRGRAPRAAKNARARGSRRTSRATSTGPPGDSDPDEPPPRRKRPSRPPKQLGSPGRNDARPRVAHVRGGRR